MLKPTPVSKYTLQITNDRRNRRLAANTFEELDKLFKDHYLLDVNGLSDTNRPKTRKNSLHNNAKHGQSVTKNNNQ